MPARMTHPEPEPSLRGGAPAPAADARAEALTVFSHLLSESERLEQVFAALPGLLSRAIACDYVEVVAGDRGGERFVVEVSVPPLVKPGGPSGFSPEQLAACTATAQHVPGEAGGGSAEALAQDGYGRVLDATMHHASRPLGLLRVARKAAEPFTGADERFLAAVAALTAQALAHARRFERMEIESARNRALTEVATLLSEGASPDRVFERLTALIGPAIEVDYVGLALADAEGMFDVFQSGAGYGQAVSRSGPSRVNLDRVARNGRGVSVYRVSDGDTEVSRELSGLGMTWGAVAAVRLDETPQGVLHVTRREDRLFDDGETAFLGALATLFAHAAAARQREHASAAAATRSDLLNELSILLNAGEPLERIFPRVDELVRSAVEADFFSLAAVSAADPEKLDVVGVQPPRALRKRRSLSMAEAGVEPILATGERVTQYRTDRVPLETVRVLHQAGVLRVAAAVLLDGGRAIGVMSVGRSTNRLFSAEDVRFIELVSTLLGQAAANRLRIERSQQETEQAREHAEEQEILAEVAAAAARESTPEGLVTAVQGPVARFVPEAVVSFGYLEGDAAVFPRVVGGRLRVPLGPYMREAIERGHAVGIQLPPNVDSTAAGQLLAAGVRVLALTASYAGGAPAGILSVGTSVEGHRFSERDVAMFRLVAHVVGQAMTNTLAVERQALEAEEQRLVAEVAAAATRISDPIQLLQALVELLRQFVPRPFAAFGYFEGDESAYPTPSGVLRMPVTPMEERARSSGQEYTPELPADTPPDHLIQTYGVHAIATTVAESGAQPVGMLVVASRESGHVFSERDLRIFRLLASILGPVMASSRAALETLRERALYDLALQSLSEAVLLMDHDLRGVFANPHGRRILAALAPAQDLNDVIPGLAAEARVALREALDSGRRTRGRTTLTIEGAETWLDFEAVPLTHPNYRLLIVATDVTAEVNREETERRHQGELAQAARRTEQERELYRLVLDRLSEAVILLDEDFAMPYANPPGIRLANQIDPERRLRTLDENTAALPRAAQGPFRAAAEQGTGSRGRMRARDFEGRPRWYDYELIPLDRPPLKVIVVAADVTAEVEYEAEREQSRKQMEQAARLAALGELIGGVAHELNNPLTAILGFAEILSGSETLAEHAEEVGIIHKEALRARDVVRDLLFIARPGPVERANVALADVVGHIERIRRSSWAREEFTVSLDTGGLTGTVWGNEHQLTQVLINLVTNAEHALEGVPRPTLAIAARTEGGEVIISVRDNGLGMSAATRDRIFEPFFTTKQGVGTGLGLSLSYTMVTAHGGRIEVDSEPGHGSEFRVILPAPPETPAAAPRPVEAPAAGLRILVVDDEPNLRKVCQRLIARMGHSCEVADSSASARDLAAAVDFDLVICDYRLASETAAAVIAGFEEVAPQLLGRTVIATGASTDPGVIELTERYGMQLVAKPYGLEQIATLIGEASRNSDG